MRAAVFQKEGHLCVEERDLPKIGKGEILLQIKACGLCGTDILKVQKRSVPSGTVLGHEVAGIVAETGAGVTKFQKGDRVVVAHHVPCGNCHFCRHENFSMCAQFRKTNLDPGGFAEFVRIPGEHVEHTAFKIPGPLSFEEASFTEPIACCLRAIHRSRLLAGDTVLVIGLGSIGLLLVQLLKKREIRVFATDLVEERIRLAEDYGAVRFHPDLLKTLPIQGVDMILFTAGSTSLLKKSLSWIRDGGKLHLFSSLAEGEEIFDINEIYHRELELFSTYSSSPKELKEALDLLASGSIRVKNLITTRPKLEEIPEAIQQTLDKEILKAVVVPSKDGVNPNADGGPPPPPLDND